jgi:hypothetical protein
MTEPRTPSSGFGEWDEWHYRHQFFWSAATKWIVSILATAAVPYTAQSVRDTFGAWLIVFPIFACLLGAVGFLHLLAEHARALYLRWHVGYREKEEEFLRDRTPSLAHQWLRRPVAWRIAPWLFSVLAIGFITLTGLNLVFLQGYMRKDLIGSVPGTWALITTAMGWLWSAVGAGVAAILLIANLVRPKDKSEPGTA